MKDYLSFLDMMVKDYESNTGSTLSTHDPVFHAFNAVAHVGDILSVYQDKEARERYILTAKRRNSVLAHAIGKGYVPRKLEPDRHMQTIVFTDAVPQQFYITKGQQVRTEIEDGNYTVAEVLNDTLVTVGTTTIDVEVEVGITLEQVLGTGNGQEVSFPLEGDYVYQDSMYLKVLTPMGTEIWEKVDNFLDSEGTDNHFIIDIGVQNYNDMMRPNDLMLYIRCGNGVSGRVFPEGSQIIAVYKQVNPYMDTMPLGVFTVWEDSVPYLKSTSNTSVTKDKILPEDTEVIRRNAIYTESIGKVLVSKSDFERAVIVQAVDKISKSYAEYSIIDGTNTYTIYVAGDNPLSDQDLTDIRDLMYTNYYRAFNDTYQLVRAPQTAGTITLDVIFNKDISVDDQNTKIATIKSTLASYVKALDLGQTYSVPEMWRLLLSLTTTSLKDMDYVQFTSSAPTVDPNAELVITEDNIVVTNNTPV